MAFLQESIVARLNSRLPLKARLNAAWRVAQPKLPSLLEQETCHILKQMTGDVTVEHFAAGAL